MRYSTSKIRLFFIYIFLSLPMSILAQDYDQITKSGDYLYGEGKAASAIQADRLALSYISEQISVAVTSEVSLSKTTQKTSEGVESQNTTNDLINTYSTATLTNCKKMVLENGPRQYRILRYIHKEEISRMFRAREQKVLEMINIGLRAEEERKFDVALKHYYWAQLLLDTVLYPNDLYCDVPEGNKQVVVWLPLRINTILDNLSFAFGGYATDDKTLATIYVTYKDAPVTSLDYTYWDGVGWSVQTQAKDGLSAIELRANTDISSIDIKVEYSYEQEMQIDPDLQHFAEFLAPKQYNKAYKNSVQLSSPRKPIVSKEKEWKVEDVVVTGKESGAVANVETVAIVEEIQPYKKAVKSVLSAISSRNYNDAQSLFTKEGFDIYSKLISYGRAQIISGRGFDPIDEIEVAQFEDRFFCRSIPMQFSFPNYNKNFVEIVVFVFDQSGKIASVQFGLEQTALNDILSKRQWSSGAKLVLVDFLENFKTAYALSRLDYLQSVFSDDALIITGRIVKHTSVEGQINLRNQEHIVYNRQTKSQYINNLRRSFASKEYINLQFSNLKVTKMGRGDKEIYCMEIKQDYYSSNYADTGYLMLVVDVDDPVNPIIHVRTWQPQPDPEFGLFSPGDV